MLKRIDPSEVVLGMYIHKLEGNWFSHPFWRARFLLTDPAQAARLRDSDVPAVIIDTELGLDPDARPVGAADSPAAAPAVRPRLRQPARVSLPPPPALHPMATPAKPMTAPPGDTTRSFGRARVLADRGLKAVSRAFLEMRLGKAFMPGTVAPVIDAIIASMHDNPFAFNGLMQFRRDNERVYHHALATSALMIALGRNLHLSQIDLHAAGLAGLMLDAGVNLLPHTDDDDPLHLPPEVWRSHVALGHDFIIKSGLADSIARACLEHHERFDGTGWPNRSTGQSLSRLGRMAAICDAYDVLCSGAGGRPGLDPAEALHTMQADAGAYDPAILAVFLASVGVWPAGALVHLRSGRMAVVIEQNREAADLPLVAAFFLPETGQRIDTVWIDLATCYGADAIVAPAVIDALPPATQPLARAALAAVINRVTTGGKARAGARKAA